MKYHKTRDGETIPLTELTDQHLRNIINYMERCANEGLIIGYADYDYYCYGIDADIVCGDEALRLIGLRMGCTYEEYKQELEARQKRNEPWYGQWISVEDELPVGNTGVIGWARIADVRNVAFRVELCFVPRLKNKSRRDKCWVIEKCNKHGNLEHIDAEVTHWMPLPDPPNNSKNSNS